MIGNCETRKKKSFLKAGVTSLALIWVLLAGCQNTEQQTTTSDDSSSKAAQKDSSKSFEEQGYEFSEIRYYDGGINVVVVIKDSKEYYGTIDDSGNWLIEPTREFGNLEFHEGLDYASIPETREMRLSDDPKAKLWGFIDATGQWVIEPTYRSVKRFSSGVAIVTTVEEDRDDLSNKRRILIDKTGKELAELPSQTPDKVIIGTLEDSFKGDYVSSEYGFFDKLGHFTLPHFEESDSFHVVGDNIINHIEHNNYPDRLEITDLNGNLIKEIPSPEDGDIYELSFENVLVENGLFIVEYDNGISRLVDSNANTVLEGDSISMGYADTLAFVYSSTDNSSNGLTGIFYNLTGKEVAKVKNMVGSLYLGDRYFVEGNEYYKLIDIDANVLIDESKKITYVGVESNGYFDDSGLSRKLVQIEYRNDATDTKPNKALLNLETLQIIDLENL